MQLKYNAIKTLRKETFTLSEVLITLGIIGVISALTIPNLINSYNKKITESRLLKFYSAFNQAIKLSIVENGEPEGWDDYWALSNYSNIDRSSEIDKAFSKYIKPYMKIATTKNVQGSDRKIQLYYLLDGSAFGYNYQHIRDIYFFPANAEKCLQKPTVETRGTCMFPFMFDYINCDSDKTSRANSKYYCKKGLSPNSYGWDGELNSLYNASYGCNLDKNGLFCTQLIKENNWKIPKDYPRHIRY